MMLLRMCMAAIVLLFLNGCSVKTDPISEQDLADLAKQDLELIFKSQEPIDGPLSIGEAMSRALKYNLESRVKRMEEALASESLSMARMDMLPILAASAGYLDRNNVSASSSTSVLTQQQSLEPSTSQDQQRNVADMRFSWNILDFGVSYLQAKQDSDRYLVAQRVRQDMMLKLLQQVRGAFWRAATMQILSGELKKIAVAVEDSLVELQEVRKNQLRPPLSTLTDIRTLFDMSQQLGNMQSTVNAAQVELATLINTSHGSEFTLIIPETMELPPTIPTDVSALELTALVNSSNYVSQVYNYRIEQTESRKSLMRLLPGIEFSYSVNYDSNSYMVNNSWGEAGVRVTANLMRMAFINKIRDYGEARENFAISQRLAVNMAVVTRLHLAWQQHQNNINKLFFVEKLSNVDKDISLLTQDAERNNAVDKITRIRNDLRSLSSKMSYFLAYAETQDSFGIFLLSLGIDPIPENYQEKSVASLGEDLETYYQEIKF